MVLCKELLEDTHIKDIQSMINNLNVNFKANTTRGFIANIRSFLTYNEINLSWNKIKRPTTEKIHYHFELKDTKKIIAGMRLRRNNKKRK